MRRTFLLASVLGCVAPLVRLAPWTVDAGTAVELDLEGLTRSSDLVFEGRVDSLRCVETPEGRIETELRLFVDRHFVGEEVAERVVRIPGGVLPDGRGLLLPGMPQFRAGEELILFLSAPGSTGVRVPVGLAQGKLSLFTDLSGERVLAREPASLTKFSPSTGAHRESDGWEVLGYAETVATLRAAADHRRAAEFQAPLEERAR
ncbi:MAG: hypothetical protein H6831_02835 [Planctomycetes bacterium]|nr:hypothetical protein [Planctomycetota bacterium]MCB9903318.1 hypothetical protein [Planctomycetota bacterium]